ncbi:E3 ubiquitin-protein ligase UHRF1-like isoform X1 [Salvelinus namaycush]|uniref:E3 ubiquitin-protein ligase UHRF n=1 Tax=Salvelinus namaycush TaxID=8040 RepID=A0A8U0PL95_SALNM|nr:E3 ubiquitin-protein ligase UHRF1-like isoform X1 [Salvelinus namaycush]
MWIQIRTIDGKETRTIEDLSRLTKIEYLRLKIKDIFNVNPQQQRLFYRGKQMEDGHTLYDYNVGLNDIVQLLIRSQAGDAPDSPLVPPIAPPVNPKDCDTMPMSSSTALPPTTPNTTAGAATTPSLSKPTIVAPKPIPALTTVNNNTTTSNSSTTNTSTTSTKTSNTSDPNNNRAKSSSPPAPLEKLDNQPSTSTRPFLIDAGIGVFKINELVDCRDISIGAWFEACIDNVTRTPKGQNSKAPTAGKVGRPSKRTNGKLETEPGQGQSHPSSSTDNSNGNNNSMLNSDNGPGSSTSQTDSTATDKEKEDVTYHIKYDDYPENGVVEMCGGNVRPRARTLLRWDQLSVGLVVMVNYNIEIPEERGFWFDAEITALNEISRTNKEVRVKILLGGPGDVIPDCKLLFLDEIYQIEKTGAPSLSAADGQFKRKSGPECKHCKADPDSECRFCSCCVCGGKQDAHMQLLCDECNMAFHIYCLNPPLSTIPDDEDWYCPTCKNDTSEVVKAGEKLKASKKKAKMPSAHTESQRDWGKGMACVGRTKECTIVPSNHYGPVPGVPVGTTWKFRVQVSEAGVHRPHVGGIHGRSNDGSYSLVLAGGFEDEVDRGDEFTYTGSGGRDLSGNKRIGEHSFDQTLTHYNRALALNCDAPINDKDGAESRNWREGKPVRVVRSSKGRRISKYAPEEGNRYDGIYKVVKYWPEIGKCGFLVWRYLLRRDDLEPAPWTPEGLERIQKLGLAVQYPPGYVEAMANKTKKEANARPGCTRSKKQPGRGRPRLHPLEKKVKEDEKKPMEGTEQPQSNGSQKTPKDKETEVCKESAEPRAKRLKMEEAFQLTEQQQSLIKEDQPNKKNWDEAMGHLKEGPNFLRKVEQTFMCVCCQELAYQPVTTVCAHNVCKTCLLRSFRAEVYTCPACRHDLGKDYIMVLNKTLQLLLDQFFPGYSKGR